MAIASDVTPPAAWKRARNQGVLVTLPSGNKARLRRTLSLMKQIEAGTLENPLMRHVSQMLKAVQPDAETAAEAARTMDGQISMDLKDMDEDAHAAMVGLIATETPDIFVSPKVVQPPVDYKGDPAEWDPEDDDTISTYDVSWEDKIFAFSFAQGGPATLDRFPDSTEDVAAESDGEGVGDDSEQDSEAG